MAASPPTTSQMRAAAEEKWAGRPDFDPVKDVWSQVVHFLKAAEQMEAGEASPVVIQVRVSDDAPAEEQAD